MATMGADRNGVARMPGFRQCLAMPPALYRNLTLDQPADLDGQMAKTLLDYKSGRPQQAYKRFLQAKKAEGLDAGLRLVLQRDRLTEGNAPLLIFELLFQLMAGEMPASDTVGLYLDAISCFDPDVAICHGAIYNSLILIALRRSEPALAELNEELSRLGEALATRIELEDQIITAVRRADLRVAA